jgi:hypothetical protein
MKIRQIELPKDGVPKLVITPVVKFMTIKANRGKIWLYLLEDEDNKPTRKFYFAPFSTEMNDPAKWDYFESVNFEGRVIHYYIMQG